MAAGDDPVRRQLRRAQLVRVAPEVLDKLARPGGSGPVVVLGVERQEDGTWEMTLRSAGDELERLDRYESALRTIRGPEDCGPWIEVYRAAGGGYAGLQAVAEAALDGP